MNILAFETSCDETSAAIIQDGRRILTNVVASQIDLHKRWGGVVPELASRQHIIYIVPTLEAALKQANMTWADIDAIAVTNGPGLAGALLVGVNVAKGLAFALGKPLLPVNHIEGHIYANWLVPNTAAKPKPVVSELPASADAEAQTADSANGETSPTRDIRAAYGQFAPVYRPAGSPTPPAPRPTPPAAPNSGEPDTPPEPQFPLIAMVVSGGHTELVLMTGHGQYELLGKTIDDAAGEAFDKVGRILGLGYPGGPAIQKLVDAEHADPHKIDLPRAWLRGTYDFSFSGLKTAVMRKIDEYGGLPEVVEKPRPFAEVEAAQQAAQRAANTDPTAVRPGHAPEARVSEPLEMPATEVAPSNPVARFSLPPTRQAASTPNEAVATPPAPASHTVEPAARETTPAPPSSSRKLKPLPQLEEEDEETPEPSFRLTTQPSGDRLSGLFVRQADEVKDEQDDSDDDADDEGNTNQSPLNNAPAGPGLERRPLRQVEQAAPRPRAIYSMFDDQDEQETPPASAPAPTRPKASPPPVAGSGLERRPLRTSATPDLRATPQPPAPPAKDEADEEDLPRTLSPQGRNLRDAARRVAPSAPQPTASTPQPPAAPTQRTSSPATNQGRNTVFPRSTILGDEQPPQQSSNPTARPQPPNQRPSQQPTNQRANQPPAQQRPNQPAPQRPASPPPAQSPAQQRPNQPAASAPQPPASTPQPPLSNPQQPLNRPRPLPPSQPQRGGFSRPGQLPQRGVNPAPKPLAQREITPVPKGSNAADDDGDERDYIAEDDDTPRSRVGSAADDFDGDEGEERPNRNRSLGADSPRPQGVRGGVGGDSGAKKGTAPVALIAAAFQLAVVEVLVEKTAAAAEQYGAKMVLIAGGVAANRLLREMMSERLNVPVMYPIPSLCTDNAAMIGAAAYYRYYHAQGANRDQAGTSDWDMDIEPNAHFLGEA